MARVIQNVGPRVVPDRLQKFLEGDTVVKILSRMQLVADIHSRFIKCVENRQPPVSQFTEAALDQSGGALWPGVDRVPEKSSREGAVFGQPQVLARLGGLLQRLHGPLRTGSGIVVQMFGGKTIKECIVSRMDSHQLTLQGRVELCNLHTLLMTDPFDLIGIGCALCQLLQIHQPWIPGGDLHPLVSQAGSPPADRSQIKKGFIISNKLCQKKSRSFHNGLVSYFGFCLCVQVQSSAQSGWSAAENGHSIVAGPLQYAVTPTWPIRCHNGHSSMTHPLPQMVTPS